MVKFFAFSLFFIYPDIFGNQARSLFRDVIALKSYDEWKKKLQDRVCIFTGRFSYEHCLYIKYTKESWVLFWPVLLEQLAS